MNFRAKNYISNTDNFEEFIRKMCHFKGGWDNMHHLLSNAHFLHKQLSAQGEEWPGLRSLENTKSGQYLIDMLVHGQSSEKKEASAQVDYLRKQLANFGLYGLKLNYKKQMDTLS